MITKGIIEQIIDKNHIKVRIPVFNKISGAPQATATENLNIATICSIPNSNMNFQLGDIVFIGFEDHMVNKPVILGQLQRDIVTLNSPEITVNSLVALANVVLPSDTTIGEVTGTEIQMLHGVNANLQFQLDILSDRIAKLEEATT